MTTVREARGLRGFHAGQAAELRIAQEYARRGYGVVRQRWRGRSAEIDLILRDGSGLIFVEVKQSRSFDAAAQKVSRRQQERILRAAEEFAGQEPDGLLTAMRFDVALVDGQGDIRVIENAFGGW